GRSGQHRDTVAMPVLRVAAQRILANQPADMQVEMGAGLPLVELAPLGVDEEHRDDVLGLPAQLFDDQLHVATSCRGIRSCRSACEELQVQLVETLGVLVLGPMAAALEDLQA